MSAHNEAGAVDSSAINIEPSGASSNNLTAAASLNRPSQSFRVKFNADLTVQSQLRVEEKELPSLYAAIDKDCSGSIDYREFSTFLMGRFGVSDSAVSVIFKKFDTNVSGGFNLAEFSELIAEMNSLLENFDNEEISTLTKYGEVVGSNSAFACFCCPCTCGMSFYLAGKANAKVNEDLKVFLATKKSRLDEAVESKLSYSLGATFLKLHPPSGKQAVVG